MFHLLDSTIEETQCDFKVALEVRRPKSWLKSVSAYANGIGGKLIFGVDNNKHIVGLENAQNDAEIISSLIKERIVPLPIFVLESKREEGKDILILTVNKGHNTPYYYKADGIKEVYVRVGNESVLAPHHVLNHLLIQGMNRTFDTLTSQYYFKDYSFSKLRERYKKWTRNSWEDKLFDSFEIRTKDGMLTNAGALIADESPIRNSRLICTRWNGLDKSGGIVDAIDSEEYTGSLIILLSEGVGFVKRNTKKSWKKTSTSRIDMPEYCERSVFESIVNALIHRDYLELGSEVHIDIFDDRLTIYSPGGMTDGTYIQNRDLDNVSSTRRNPVIADIFSRLGLMERQGSGFKKITESYHSAHNFRSELEPKFYSDTTSFQVTLFNLNYSLNHLEIEKGAIRTEEGAIRTEEGAIRTEEGAIRTEKGAIRTEEGAIRTEEGAIQTEKGAIRTEEGAIRTEEGAIQTEKGAIRTEEGAIQTEKGAIRTEEGAIQTEKGAIRTEEGAIQTEKGAIQTEKGAIRTEEGAIQQKGIDIDRRLVSLDLPLSMQESISSIMKEKGSWWIFSCSEIAEMTLRSVSYTRKVIKILKTAGLIEPVKGFGKGKYKFVDHLK